MKGQIAEIFKSIQGEGIYFGEKQLFIRFFGCNLKCRFCDTSLKYFKEYDPDELFLELQAYGKDFGSISFTGGEPLWQKDFLKSIARLTSRYNYKNYLDTNGTLPDALADVIEYIDIIAMDIKLPSSTGGKNFYNEHKSFLEIASAKELLIKIVICNSTLESELREAVSLIKEKNKYAVLVLQPNSAEDQNLLLEKSANFKQICMKEDIITCIIPQMHKIINVK